MNQLETIVKRMAVITSLEPPRGGAKARFLRGMIVGILPPETAASECP